MCNAGWRPIEEAPKRGFILLWRDISFLPDVGYFCEDLSCEKPKPYWASVNISMGIRWMRQNPPLFWMPLPEPPEQEIDDV